MSHPDWIHASRTRSGLRARPADRSDSLRPPAGKSGAVPPSTSPFAITMSPVAGESCHAAPCSELLGHALSLNGRDIVIVQTKALRLGMYLLGQALFLRELIKDRFAPRSIRTVALCAIDDAILHPIAERYGVEVVVDDGGSFPSDHWQGPTPSPKPSSKLAGRSWVFQDNR
jgi:hypothetical protein